MDIQHKNNQIFRFQVKNIPFLFKLRGKFKNMIIFFFYCVKLKHGVLTSWYKNKEKSFKSFRF